MFLQRVRFVAKGVGRRGSRSACVLPFGFGGKSVIAARLGGQPFAIGTGGMLRHANGRKATFTHAERHVGIGLGRLALLEFVGNRVSRRRGYFVNGSRKDIQVGHPNIVGIPSQLALGHPKRSDLDRVNRSLVRVSIGFGVWASHQKFPTRDRDHFNLGVGVFNPLHILLHLLLTARDRVLDGEDSVGVVGAERAEPRTACHRQGRDLQGSKRNQLHIVFRNLGFGVRRSNVA